MKKETLWFNQMRFEEENNFVASSQRLGSTMGLTQGFVDAYEAFAESLRLTKDPPEHIQVLSFLFLGSRYQFQKALLECLRTHLTDSVQITRRAIELAAFAARIAQHPELAEKWRVAVEDEAKYKEFVSKFSGKALFPVNDAVLKELGSRYDYASKMFHASVASVASRARMEFEEPVLNFYFNVYEVDNDDLSEPAQTLLWILNTHLLMLGSFGKSFKGQLGRHSKAWDKRLQALEASLKHEFLRWKPIIEQSTKGDLAPAVPTDHPVMEEGGDAAQA